MPIAPPHQPIGNAHEGRALTRLLDSSALARVVPHLPPEALHRLIRAAGLAACGEVLTAATPAQLTALADLDLWRDAPQPGDEGFDAARFGEWVEALVAAGDSAAARAVAALDAGVVIAGLSRHVRVLDPGVFEPVAPSDDEPLDRRGTMHGGTGIDGLECEIGGFLVRARRAEAWDAIGALLIALDADHPVCCHALMDGCRRLSNSRPEIDGLDELLAAPEQFVHDVARERDQRRSTRGYVTAGDGRAFLQSARVASHPATDSPRPTAATNDPIARAYFRAADEAQDTAVAATPLEASAHQPAAGVVLHDALDASVVAVLSEAGLMPERPVALLEGAGGPVDGPDVARLRRSLAWLQQHDEVAHVTRLRELAFLANTLQAGCSVQSRPFTPAEAADAAACTCNLGLECWPGHAGAAAETLLADHDLIAVFRVGWSVLHRDVSLFVADRLSAALADLRDVGRDTDEGLRALRRHLARQRAAGTPWLARDAADVLATIDLTIWHAVVGLLDECPILPATVAAVLERRVTPLSPEAFAFIATTSQIGDIRVFMRALPERLRG